MLKCIYFRIRDKKWNEMKKFRLTSQSHAGRHFPINSTTTLIRDPTSQIHRLELRYALFKCQILYDWTILMQMPNEIIAKILGKC